MEAQEKTGFLSRIYTSNEFNFVNSELSNLDYNQLENQDAIILNELTDIPQALQTTLKTFVSKGGNVVLIESNEINTATVNSFLNNFGKIQFQNLQKKRKINHENRL